MEKKLKCKMSTFQTDLSYNEWAEQFNVSRAYVKPTPYFANNPKNPYVFADARANVKRDPFMWKIRKTAEALFNLIPF